MKFIILFFISNIAFGNLYLTTNFSSSRVKKAVITKHHIFIDRPYLIKYEEVRFMFNLKKIEKNGVVSIESEILKNVDGRFQTISGSFYRGNFDKPFIIAPKNDTYKLIINFEKITE